MAKTSAIKTTVPMKRARPSKLDNCPGVNSTSASGKRMFPLPKYFKSEGEARRFDDSVMEISTKQGPDTPAEQKLPVEKKIYDARKCFDKMSAFDTTSTLRSPYDFVDDTLRSAIPAGKNLESLQRLIFLLFPPSLSIFQISQIKSGLL